MFPKRRKLAVGTVPQMSQWEKSQISNKSAKSRHKQGMGAYEHNRAVENSGHNGLGDIEGTMLQNSHDIVVRDPVSVIQ